jgi:3-deoxy-D-manno-octulosonic-acid transferase
VISLLYDLFLLLFGVPFLLFQRLFRGKYKESLPQKLGFAIPKGKKTIWIHTISLGETRAAIPLFELLKKEYPSAQIAISTTTEAGQAEARKSMPTAACHFYLPLDLSFLMRRVLKRIDPEMVILVESDFWYNLLKAAKRHGATVSLVNGKISEKSTLRFGRFPRLTNSVFSKIDLFCVQNEEMKRRFESLGVGAEKLIVTGNLKYDTPITKLDQQEKEALRKELGINQADRVIVLGSTHEPEEEWLLTALANVWREIPNLKVILVPRHADRFPRVAELLAARKIPFIPYSRRGEGTGREQVILADVMGQLRNFYQIADIGIVCGSFIDRLGGHNILEPIQCGAVSLFGPHMYSQREMLTEILGAKAGKQVTLTELPATLITLLLNASHMEEIKSAGERLTTLLYGSSQRTLLALKK